MGYLMILIIVIFAVYYVVNDKKGKLEVFKRYHGEEKRIVTAIDDIRCFFDMREEDEYTLDDQTWYDLNMDEVWQTFLVPHTERCAGRTGGHHGGM